MPCYFHRQFKVLLVLPVLCFANFAVLLLPVQTAEGQVHGSGVSAASLFDTVVNLPADSATFSQNSIGGVAGETAQLNINAGSTFGFFFDANSGTEVNFFSGDDYDSLTATDGEVNVVGGTITEIYAYDSQVNVSGGNVSDIYPYDSQVNVSGGNISGLHVEGSQINFSGGSVRTILASRGSVVNIDGGAVEFLLNVGHSNINGGDIGSLDGLGAVLDIRGGNFATDGVSGFYDGTIVNLFGKEFFIDGVPYANGDPIVFTDEFFTLSGTWEDGTSFAFDVEEVFDIVLPVDPTVGSAGYLAPRMQFGFGSTLNLTVVPEPSSAAFIALASVIGSVRRRRG